METRRIMSEKQILDLLPIARSTLQNLGEGRAVSQVGFDRPEPQGVVRG